MSRCLPFPPPNYVKNGVGGEALLQQLELRRKRVEYAKKEEEEKREKKRSHDDDDDDDHGDVKKKRKKEKREKKMSHDVKKYTKLIQNWVPLPLQMVPTDVENEEWLTRKNDSKSNGESETTTQDDVSTSIAEEDLTIKQGIQPLASYLPHADIYALPYVLPF